jgi:hypothetical protein
MYMAPTNNPDPKRTEARRRSKSTVSLSRRDDKPSVAAPNKTGMAIAVIVGL